MVICGASNIKKFTYKELLIWRINNIKKNKKQDRIEKNKEAKKIKNMKFWNLNKRKVGDTMLEIIENCSKFMVFYADESKEKLKLMKSNSCKNRFLPNVFLWRKAKRYFEEFNYNEKINSRTNQYAFLFLTLLLQMFLEKTWKRNKRLCCYFKRCKTKRTEIKYWIYQKIRSNL